MTIKRTATRDIQVNAADSGVLITTMRLDGEGGAFEHHLSISYEDAAALHELVGDVLGQRAAGTAVTKPGVTAAIWDANLAAAKKCMPEASAIDLVTKTHGPRPEDG